MENFITKNLKENEKKLDEILHIHESFDILKRNFKIGNRDGVMYFINGFCDNDMIQKVEEFFCNMTEEELPQKVEDFSENKIPYIQVDLFEDKYNVLTFILSGVVCLMIDGYEKAMLIDVRNYPARNVQEPEKYKVLRGSRDGFVETLLMNTALIRRRIRNPEYMCEIVRAGKSSRTDIAICYINGRADKKLLNYIKEQIQKIEIDALPMNQESLSECIHKGHWFNFSKVSLYGASGHGGC